MSVEVLTVSSKGQISLPSEFRKKMSIDKGDKLAAYAAGDVIMLKPIRIPTEKEFLMLLDEAKDWADHEGYNVEDVDDIIKSVRRKKQR